MWLPKRFVELLRKARRQFHWRIMPDGGIRTRNQRGGECMCPIEAAYVVGGGSLRNIHGVRLQAEDVTVEVGLHDCSLVMTASDCFSSALANEGLVGLAARRQLLAILGLKEPKPRRAV